VSDGRARLIVGRGSSPLENQFVSPPIPEGHLPTWVGPTTASPRDYGDRLHATTRARVPH
jgi:hypothetical protein